MCTELDRFGNQFAWQRIAYFFKSEMGLECRFEPFQHFAEDRKIEEMQLRIVIENQRGYEYLIQKSEEVVGHPCNGRVLWESKEEEVEKRMQIMETIFEKDLPLPAHL